MGAGGCHPPRGVATLGRMTSPQERPRADEPSPPSGERRARIDPAALPMPISRRRLATVAGLLAAAWLGVAIGRQVGAASAAPGRAELPRRPTPGLPPPVTTPPDDP